MYKVRYKILVGVVAIIAAFGLWWHSSALDKAPAPKVFEATESMTEATKLKSVSDYIEARKPGKLTNNLQLNESQKALVADVVQSDVFKQVAGDSLTQNHIIELFGVYSPRAGDQTAPCPTCTRLEMYDFTDHSSFITIAKPGADYLVKHYQLVQPDIPSHLIALSRDIALAHPYMQSAMKEHGVSAGSPSAIANTKPTVKQSRCERQRHLCVAPTFATSSGALWGIVDLTDVFLAAVAWTNYPADQEKVPLTLKKIEYDSINQEYCGKSHSFNDKGWTGDYSLSSSDGLVIRNLAFKGELLAENIKLVDWHVGYSSGHDFGQAGAVGCPVFSQATVVAATPPKIVPLKTRLGEGFELDQEYWSDGWPAPCNYFYTQRLQLYNDGSFRVVAESDGGGCGNDATYRPVTRIKLAPALSSIKGLDKETWFAAIDRESTTIAQTGRYSVRSPRSDEFGTGERGDNAYVYFSEGKGRDEGDSEISTIGGCCNTDYKQGPEQFINDEAISGQSTVLWYVAQMKNDDTDGSEYCWAKSLVGDDGKKFNKVSPCASGPYFQRTAKDMVNAQN